jgi:hypothetical protein
VEAAEGLTNRFGENFACRDTSENEFGIAPRNFNSFREATAEAGMSRVYGGFILKIRVWWGRWRVGRFANWLLRNLMKLK